MRLRTHAVAEYFAGVLRAGDDHRVGDATLVGGNRRGLVAFVGRGFRGVLRQDRRRKGDRQRKRAGGGKETFSK